MEENKIYVAVGEDVEDRESALNWALKFSEGCTVCVIHVHVPAQNIHQPDREVDVKECQEWKRNEVIKMLDNCLKRFTLKQIPSEKFCIEKDVITDGILELISRHGIRRLVMGAGIHNKKLRIKKPTSRKANDVLQFAPKFCHIWFVCKDRLIYTREGTNQVNPDTEEIQFNRFSYSKSSIYFPSVNSAVGSSPLTQSTDYDLSPASKLRQPTSINNYSYDGFQQTLAEAKVSRQEARQELETQWRAKKEAMSVLHKVKATEEEITHVTKDLKNIQIKLHEVSKVLLQAAGEVSLLERQIQESGLKGKEMLFEETLQNYRRQCEDVQAECDNAVEAVQVLKKQVSQEPSVPKFSFEFSQLDIEEATNYFDPSLRIGEGNICSLYKGFLYYTELAIKTHKHCLQGIAEFEQEVGILSKLRHPNLVTLIGACPDSLALVYEYLPNGNLEDRLSCKDHTRPLPWQTRIRIVTELCSILNFLHSIQPCSIVHGDLSLKNVLLDANFSCKLSGFGSCHIISNSNLTATTEDPEFCAAGHLSAKSDVYSFGIILLRLLTGRATLKVVKKIQDALENDHLHSILDHSAGDWPIIRAKQLAYMALKCCDVEAKHRTDLGSEVWSVLKPVITPSENLSSPLQILNEDQVPSHFTCPIFQEIMREPHFAADGFTYEKDAIAGWFEGGHDTSPMTNLKLDNHNLTPNLALRSAIQEFLQQHHFV